MDKIPTTILRGLTAALFLLAVAFTAGADTCRLLAAKGVTVTSAGRTVAVGETFDASDVLIASWQQVPAGESRYFQFMNMASGTVGVVVPHGRSSDADSDPTLWERLKSYFSSVKKCSTRAADNETDGGLADRLSQTFYMLDTSDGTGVVRVATDLPLDACRYFEARCTDAAGRTHVVRFGAEPGAAVLTPEVLAGVGRTAPRTVLRLAVDYVDTVRHTRTPLCDAMNVILIAP